MRISELNVPLTFSIGPITFVIPSQFNKSVGPNKTTQACPELVEGRSAWWRFRHTCTGCRKRLFSLALEKPYSGYADTSICRVTLSLTRDCNGKKCKPRNEGCQNLHKNNSGCFLALLECPIKII